MIIFNFLETLQNLPSDFVPLPNLATTIMVTIVVHMIVHMSDDDDDLPIHPPCYIFVGWISSSQDNGVSSIRNPACTGSAMF